MPSEYQSMRRRLKRSIILTEHISIHIGEVWQKYNKDFPEFGERLLVVGKFNTELDGALRELIKYLARLGV